MEKAVIQRIEEVMLDNNLNKTQLAIKLDLDQKTVNCYLNEKRKFSFEFIESIVRVFEVNPDWLLLGNGKKYHVFTTLIDSSSINQKQIEEMELKDQMLLDLRRQIEKDDILISSLQEQLNGLKVKRVGALRRVGGA